MAQRDNGRPRRTAEHMAVTLANSEAKGLQVGGTRRVGAGEELVFYRYFEGSTRTGVKQDASTFGAGFYMAMPKSVDGLVIAPEREVHGFTEEYDKLVETLRHSHAVALIGPPGSGKNMVASLYCANFGPHKERSPYDYIVPLQLGQNWDITRVAGAMIRKLRPELPNPTSQEDALNKLLEGLRYRRFLLVLDQFEAVIDPYTDKVRDGAYERLLEAAMVGAIGGSRILMLSRQDFIFETDGHRFGDFVELSRMSAKDADILLNALAPTGLRLDQAQRELIRKRTAGNPLLMSAMMSQLADYHKEGAVELHDVVEHGGWRAPLYYRYAEMRAALPMPEREALELLSVAEENNWHLDVQEMLQLAVEAAFVAGKGRPPGTLWHTRIDNREIRQTLFGLKRRLLIGNEGKAVVVSGPLAHFMRVSLNARDRRLYYQVMANFHDPSERKNEDLEQWFKDTMSMVSDLIRGGLLHKACEVMCRQQVHDYAVHQQLLAAGRYVELGSKILFARTDDGQPTAEPEPPWRALLAYRLGKVLEQDHKKRGRSRAMYEEARYWLEHSQKTNPKLYNEVMRALGLVNYLQRRLTGSSVPVQRDAPTISGRLHELPPQNGRSINIIRRKK